MSREAPARAAGDTLMAQIRRARETDHFTVLANKVLRDPRLSWRATGILVRLLSEPPDSVITSAALVRERPVKEGRDAVLAALRELERAGYLLRPRWQDGRGRWHTDWIVSSVPGQHASPGSPDVYGGWPTTDPETAALTTKDTACG